MELCDTGQITSPFCASGFFLLFTAENNSFCLFHTTGEGINRCMIITQLDTMVMGLRRSLRLTRSLCRCTHMVSELQSEACLLSSVFTEQKTGKDITAVFHRVQTMDADSSSPYPGYW